MKLVREHINEIFTEDSDPIKDMEIGSTFYKFFSRSRYGKMILTLVELYGKYQYIPKNTNGIKGFGLSESTCRNQFPFQTNSEFENFKRQLYSKYKVKLSQNDILFSADRLGIYKTINFRSTLNKALQILPRKNTWGSIVVMYKEGGYIRSEIKKLNVNFKSGTTYQYIINLIAKEYDKYYREVLEKGS